MSGPGLVAQACAELLYSGLTAYTLPFSRTMLGSTKKKKLFPVPCPGAKRTHSSAISLP